MQSREPVNHLVVGISDSSPNHSQTLNVAGSTLLGLAQNAWKSKNYSPKCWFNGDSLWYKVKNNFKYVRAIYIWVVLLKVSLISLSWISPSPPLKRTANQKTMTCNQLELLGLPNNPPEETNSQPRPLKVARNYPKGNDVLGCCT